MFLYVRMLVVMLVALYTSRVVLHELGQDDYGVYIVVGGVVGLFSFINNGMNATVQRYLNYEMGRSGDDSEKLKTIFSNSLAIHLCVAAIVFILCESVGLWFVNEKLVVPPGQLLATNIVYQTAIIGFCIIILRVPFNAVIIAHERMGIYAVISLAEAFLQLGCAFLLMALHGNKLMIYGCLILGVQFLLAVCYVAYCLKSFRECSLRPRRERGLFREMFGFAGWNMVGSLAWITRGPGVGVLLNVFFGPAINAAKGIADQVNNAVTSFTTNFTLALNPQITKNYASGQISEMELLAYRGIKFSCMIIWILSLPIITSVDTILGLWLGEVIPFASLFVILVLVDCFTNTLFGNPLVVSVSATGKIRNFLLVTSILMMAVIPASFIGFKMGLSPQTVFYFNILFGIIAGLARFGFCHKLLGFSWRYFCRYALVSVVFMVATCTSLTFALRHLIISTWHPGSVALFIYMTIIAIALAVAASWFVGMNRAERSAVAQTVKNKLHLNV